MNIFKNMQVFTTTMLEKNAQKYSNHPAIINNKEQISYRVLYEKVKRVVNQLDTIIFNDLY